MVIDFVTIYPEPFCHRKAVVLQDVLVNGYQVRMSRYLEKMDQLSKEKRDDILEIVDVLLKKDK